MADDKKSAKKPAAKPNEPTVVKAINDKAQLCAARFSPCGKVLAAGGMTGEVLRWDATGDDFAERTPLTGHAGFVQALAFGPGGKLYTGDSWGRLRAWNYAEAEARPLWDIAAAHDGWLRDVAVSPDGRTIATCGRDRLVCLRGAADGRSQVRFAEHLADVFCVAFSPDGKLLASGDLLGNVKLWDLATRKLVRDVEARPLAKLDRLQDVGGVRLLKFTADGKRLLVGGTQPKNGGNVQGTPTVLEFDVAGGKQTKLHDFGSGQVYVCDLQFLPDGAWAVALSGNPGSGKLMLMKPGEAKPIYENTRLSNCHAVSLHPAGKRLAVTTVNANSAGNGRVKGKSGEDYPGNWSPIQIIDLPEPNQTA